MKETLVGCVGFRRSQPNLQIHAWSQFYLSSLEEARGNELIDILSKITDNSILQDWIVDFLLDFFTS